VPADASSPIPPAFDQLGEHPGAVSEEIPGLLERLAEVPDPRDPRGVRHALVVVLALTACAVVAGATSLPAVGVDHRRPAVRPGAALAYGPIRCPRSGACRRRRRCGGCCWAASTARRWAGRWAAGRPAGARGPTASRTQWRSTARPCAERPGHGPQDSSARRLRPPLRPGPGPTRRWREDRRNHLLPASAGDPRRPGGSMVVTSDAMHSPTSPDQVQQSSAPPESWSPSLEDRVCGSGLSWRNADNASVGDAHHAVGRHNWISGERIDSTDPYGHDAGGDGGTTQELRQTPAEGLWDLFGGQFHGGEADPPVVVSWVYANQCSAFGADRRLDPRDVVRVGLRSWGGRGSLGLRHLVREDVPACLAESRHEVDPPAITHGGARLSAAMAYEPLLIP